MKINFSKNMSSFQVAVAWSINLYSKKSNKTVSFQCDAGFSICINFQFVQKKASKRQEKSVFLRRIHEKIDCPPCLIQPSACLADSLKGVQTYV